MNRRSILAVTSAAVPVLLVSAARPLLAQTTAAAPATTLDMASYKMQTLMVGSLSLQSSALAIDRAQNPRVREFATFERNEQLTMAQVLTDMPSPPPAPLDQASAAMLQNLTATSGTQFDASYVAAQLQGHTQLLAIQQAFLQGLSSMSSDSAHIAMLARTTIQMHLTMLADIQASMHA
jgi:putative membrane protein